MRLLWSLSICLITLFTIRCSVEEASPTQTGTPTKKTQNLERPAVPQKSHLSYKAMLIDIDGRRKFLAKNYAVNKNKEALQEAFFQYLNNSIFPYWYGTAWDFNGVSNKPGEGEIACGYFVSTTLRHIEFRLNRFKLAQKASADIADYLCEKSSIKKFNKIENVKTHLLSKSNNRIYVVGLDYHVGFITKENDELFFIHSNYIDREGVVRERFDDSPALHASNLYVVGSVSDNIPFLEKWLRGEELPRQ